MNGNIRKVSSWFLSDAGRNFSFCFAGGMSVAVMALRYIPNTILLDKYEEIVHAYRNGIAIPVHKSLKEIFNRALDLCDVPNEDKHLFRPFSVTGFDVFHAGFTFSKYGCIIGLPINFAYKDVDTIDKQNIKIMGESVVWGTPEAESLLESLVLSDNAKLYGMAREIKMGQTYQVFYNTFLGTMSVVGVYGVSNYINTRMNLYAKTLATRAISYTLITAFFLMNYYFLKDSLQIYYERRVDEELKDKDPKLVEGAIEFYDKMLKRNRALRKLMGKEGKHNYTPVGNENYSFRQQHMPIFQRKAFFEDEL